MCLALESVGGPDNKKNWREIRTKRFGGKFKQKGLGLSAVSGKQQAGNPLPGFLKLKKRKNITSHAWQYESMERLI